MRIGVLVNLKATAGGPVRDSRSLFSGWLASPQLLSLVGMAPSAHVPVAILRLGSVCQPMRGVQHFHWSCILLTCLGIYSLTLGYLIPALRVYFYGLIVGGMFLSRFE